MKIIKRFISVALSSVMLLTSADLSAFAVHSVNVPQNVAGIDDDIIPENNDQLLVTDENDIEEYDNQISEINDITKPDIADEQSISDSVNNSSEDELIHEETTSSLIDEFIYGEEAIIAPADEFTYEEETISVLANEFAYEEEAISAPADEFAYEEEIINISEETTLPDDSGETDSIDDTIVSDKQVDSDNVTNEPIYIENSPIDLSEYDFSEIVEDNCLITKSITISGKTILYKGDLTVDANITLSDESLIIVVGTINVNSGSIVLGNNCQIISFEDFRVQSKNEDETFGASSGYVRLNAGTKLTVYGDFYTESVSWNYFGYGSSSSPAIFELHGNFWQIGTDTCYFHNGISSIKTILAGDGEQHISFDRHDGSADLGQIEIQNAEQTIYLDTPMYRLYPLNSTTVIGDVNVSRLEGIGTNSHTIIGDLDVNASLSMADSYEVTGSVYVQSGCLHISNDHELIVNGDFRVQSKNEDETFGASTGYVRLNAGTKLTVYGDFYTESVSWNYFGYGSSSSPAIFELHGNFWQIGTDTCYFHNGISSIKTILAA